MPKMGAVSVSAIPKLLTLIFLVCLTTVAAGSCLSYGHSCWGGHGKRSSTPHAVNPMNMQNQNDDLFFSKLFRLLKDKPADSAAVYNAYNKDFGIFDKFLKPGHPKRSVGEEDGAPRDQNAEEFGSDADREEQESNDVNGEELFMPDEDKLMWNSKYRTMQKMMEKARKPVG